MPTVIICFCFTGFDLINGSMAKIQLQDGLGLSDTACAVGAGLFVTGYVVLESPSKMLLGRFRARKWLAQILIAGGVATAAVVFNQTSWQSDRLRILLAAGSTTPALYGIAGTLLLGASAVLFPLPPAFRAREGST